SLPRYALRTMVPSPPLAPSTMEPWGLPKAEVSIIARALSSSDTPNPLGREGVSSSADSSFSSLSASRSSSARESIFSNVYPRPSFVFFRHSKPARSRRRFFICGLVVFLFLRIKVILGMREHFFKRITPHGNIPRPVVWFEFFSVICHLYLLRYRGSEHRGH